MRHEPPRADDCPAHRLNKGIHHANPHHPRRRSSPGRSGRRPARHRWPGIGAVTQGPAAAVLAASVKTHLPGQHADRLADTTSVDTNLAGNATINNDGREYGNIGPVWAFDNMERQLSAPTTVSSLTRRGPVVHRPSVGSYDAFASPITGLVMTGHGPVSGWVDFTVYSATPPSGDNLPATAGPAATTARIVEKWFARLPRSPVVTTTTSQLQGHPEPRRPRRALRSERQLVASRRARGPRACARHPLEVLSLIRTKKWLDIPSRPREVTPGDDHRRAAAPGPDSPAPEAMNHVIVLTDLPPKTSRVFLTPPPGMVPGPSAVRDQLARASQAGVPNAPCLRAWPVRNLKARQPSWRASCLPAA